MDSATRSAIDLANVRTSEVSAERSPSAVVSLLRRKLFEPIARELPRAVLLGHWTQRSWDVTGEAIRQDCCLPVARVTDLQDALTVLNALLPPADILLCSSYYDIEEIQDALLAYDGEINILVAPRDYINKHGTVMMTSWLKEKIAARHFVPKLETLSPSDGFLGQVRRASATSNSSSPSIPGA
ncbi:hypothetical protein JCM8115_005932 [Rhodotorula mucilaginosa]|uniref:Uncharacterized protein n=1 Tax=Rhodotorula mucilaginosa TaxID=5537 RepID=A0A9P6W045_RHOMI|nr:hypothetical protein C6P46_004814 [Rhodotorula mucilaginosa]TKA51288.1 hypothetical protein B0A53_05595 [Rhodotorula sp. CCFEE 5036]